MHQVRSAVLMMHDLLEQMLSNSAGSADVCVALVCGLPGAGKTTLCKGLLQTVRHQIQVKHICFDDFLLHGTKSQLLWDETSASEWKVGILAFYSCFE